MDEENKIESIESNEDEDEDEKLFEEDKSSFVFITKYALTTGIYGIKVVIDPMFNEAHSLKKINPEKWEKICWYRTLNEAIERAEIMKRIEIKRLKKRIKVLENMNFYEKPFLGTTHLLQNNIEKIHS